MNFGGMGYTTEDYRLKEIRYVTVRTSSCLQRLVGGGRGEGGIYVCNLKELRVNEFKCGIPLFEFNLEREELYSMLQRERERMRSCQGQLPLSDCLVVSNCLQPYGL